MKVLIGVDGSAGSFEAVSFAGKLVSADHDEVIFYYAPPQISVHSLRRPDPETLKCARQSLADAVFDRARQQLPSELQGKVRTVVGERKPQYGLLVAADETRADMLVVGARGAGPLGRLLVGSVGRSVAHHATIPVMVVRPRPAESGDEAPRVLLACDGTDRSRRAAAVLQQFTWPQGSVGRVITVAESLFAGQLPEWLEQQARQSEEESMARAWVEEHQQRNQELQDELAQYCSELPSIFQDQVPLVAEGHPAEQISLAIAREKIDLVVVGARGLGHLPRLMLGSTSEQLLAHAGCSVLIVREHEQP